MGGCEESLLLGVSRTEDRRSVFSGVVVSTSLGIVSFRRLLMVSFEVESSFGSIGYSV